MNILNQLIIAHDQYHNGEESSLSDLEYDTLEEQLRKTDPANKFFTGPGAIVRGDKVKLPYKMGSLTQIWENDYSKWINDNNMLYDIIVISGKMDGVSALIVYDSNGDIQISYSRGNGIEGQDITRHIAKIPNVPNKINSSSTATIRSECIISKSNFIKFQQECVDRNYKVYKNPRNAVAGLLNSKEIPPWIYKYLEIHAYELIDDISKLTQLRKLESYGFKLVPYTSSPAIDFNDTSFENIILYNKNKGPSSDYEQDGIVIDIDSIDIRKKMNPSSNSLNPAYSKKYKIKEDINIVQATVVDVLWSPSKNKLLKPRIQIEPIELNGVTITHTNGFNARYIIDNKINTGSHLMIIRSGDVIPYIMSVVDQSDYPSIPDQSDFGAYEFNDTNVDYILLEENDIVIRKGIESFFNSLDIPSLKSGTVKKLYDMGFDNIPSIINLSEYELVDLVGKNGHKIYNGILDRFENITEYEFIGSLPCFVGIGKRLFEKIYDHYNICSGLTVEQICEVDGLELKTATKIVENYKHYDNIISDINGVIIFQDKVIHSGKLDNTYWMFTGFRDKDSQLIIENEGGSIQSGIKDNTTYLVAKDPHGKSSKIQKANKLNINIIGIDEMLEILETL